MLKQKLTQEKAVVCSVYQRSIKSRQIQYIVKFSRLASNNFFNKPQKTT